jgi:hypothetical protein
MRQKIDLAELYADAHRRPQHERLLVAGVSVSGHG